MANIAVSLSSSVVPSKSKSADVGFRGNMSLEMRIVMDEYYKLHPVTRNRDSLVAWVSRRYGDFILKHYQPQVLSVFIREMDSRYRRVLGTRSVRSNNQMDLFEEYKIPVILVVSGSNNRYECVTREQATLSQFKDHILGKEKYLARFSNRLNAMRDCFDSLSSAVGGDLSVKLGMALSVASGKFN